MLGSASDTTLSPSITALLPMMAAAMIRTFWDRRRLAISSQYGVTCERHNAVLEQNSEARIGGRTLNIRRRNLEAFRSFGSYFDRDRAFGFRARSQNRPGGLWRLASGCAGRAPLHQDRGLAQARCE